MGHIFDFQEARAYERSIAEPRNRCLMEMERQLMLNLLKPVSGETVLDIGCGTGASIEPLIESGLNVTGIDPSQYMLDIATVRLGRRLELYRGFAEDLPFDDNSFNHACFFTSLEFVDDPTKAMAEACRVAKDKVFIGFLNRYAIKGIERRLRGVFTTTIFNRARFFSIWELKALVRCMAGPVPVSWRTLAQLPNPSARMLQVFAQSQLVQRSPFGAFAGLVVTLVPRFRTRPLAIRYRPKRSTAVST